MNRHPLSELSETTFAVVLLGTGSAWPDADRSSPAFLIRCEDDYYLVDCGGGACHQLMKAGVPPPRLTTIFLTHLHIDHCVEFPALIFGAYLTGKSGPFELIGPSGVKAFVDSLFNSTYAFARPMMRSLRQKEIEVNIKEIDRGLVYEKNGLSVFALPVEHGITTVGYRFEYKGKSIVLSGDTESCPNIVELSQEADVLVMDCSFPQEFGHKKGHCIPSEVAQVASDSKTRAVCLVHLFPTCKGKEEQIIKDVENGFNGTVFIGTDLDVITP